MSTTDTTSSGGVPQQIADALQSSSQADIEKVGIALGVFLGASIITIIGFELLRANNKIVYEPKRKYAEAGQPAPPAIGYSFLAWIKPTWRYSESDLLDTAGLDAVTFLRFLRLCCWITTSLAVVLGATLIPTDLVWNLRNASNQLKQKSSALSIITLAEMSGAFLYAHVIMSYVAVAIALFFIFRYNKHMVALRWEYFRSEKYQNSFAARTLLLTSVPRQLQNDSALHQVLASTGLPYPTTEVHIGRIVGSLPDLIEKHDDMVRDLEHVLARYLKDPNNIPAKRPTVHIKKAAGLFGGERVDAIDYYTAQINKLEAAIEDWRERIAEKKPESYGFASLAAVPYAHAAAKTLKNKHPNGIEVTLAPEPRNIIWKNLVLTKAQRFRMSTTGLLYLLVLLFVNAVPLLAVALIAQMASFTGPIGFLGSWQSASSWSFNLVAGLVPPAISGLMGYLLPILMRKIAKYRGEQTRTQLDKVVTGQYFGFLIISQFIIFSLIGIFISSIATVVTEIVRHESAGSVFSTLRDQTVVIKKQFLNMSNYWLTWLPLRLWMSTFDLSQGIKLLWVWVQKSFFGRTPRDVREYTKPVTFEYSIYYANFLFVFAVGAIYGVLAPLVIIFTAVTFWVSLACYKYQFMYVAVSKVESGGQLWRVIVNRLFACLILMQIILLFVVSLDSSTTLTDRIVKIVLCLPPIAAVLAFKVYCRRRFDRQYDYYIPTGEEMAAIKVHTGDVRHHRLQRRFGHPSLHQRLFTPMVHANVKHLLPEVYRGRLEDAGLLNVEGRKLEAEEVTGGLKIAAIDEDQLEYDPKTDSDVRSIISQTTLATARGIGPPSRAGTANAFTNQYQAYLAGANVSHGDLGDTYEMNDVRDSQENLLEKRSAYSSTGFGHGRKASGGTTLYSYGTPSGTPGLEYPPGGMATPSGLEYPPSQQALTQHPNASRASIGSTGGYFGTATEASALQHNTRHQPAGSPYYNAAAMYHATGASGASPQYQQQQPPLRSQTSFGNMSGVGPYRSDSPLQMSPQMGATRPSPQFGPTRTNPPTQQPYRQPTYGPAPGGPAAGSAPSYYNAAAMYAQAPPPPPQRQQQPPQGSGYDPYYGGAPGAAPRGPPGYIGPGGQYR